MTEKSVLSEFQDALAEIKPRPGASAPACAARVRFPQELQGALQPNWAFTPFSPNPSNRYEPRPQGLSAANRDMARLPNYVGQVLGVPILVDESMAPGMLCLYDAAGSLVREIIISQSAYDVWARQNGYWRKADEVKEEEPTAAEAVAEAVAPAEAGFWDREDAVTQTPVYGLWSASGWVQWASGELITSPYIRVLRATLRQINPPSKRGAQPPAALSDQAVICEILEDGSPGRTIASK